MEKRTFIDDAKKQKLAVHYNEELLTDTFTNDICFTISGYLMPVELIALYLTCGYFYREDVLESSFYKHFNWFPQTKEQKDQGTKEVLTSSFARIKQHIESLMELGEKDDDKQTIKKWLLIKKERFDNRKELFVDKKVCIKLDEGLVTASSCHVNAFRFFSHIGAIKYLMLLREYINDAFLERKLIEEGEFYAFRLAFAQTVEGGNIEIFQLLLDAINTDSDLRRKLLESWCYHNIFLACAEHNHLVVLELLWDFAIDDINVRRKLLTIDDCWAFREAAEKGHIDVVKLLWRFADDDADLKRVLLTTVVCGNVIFGDSFCLAVSDGHFNMAKLLWELADYDLFHKHSYLKNINFWIAICASNKTDIEVVRFIEDLVGNDNMLKEDLLKKHHQIVLFASEQSHIELTKLFGVHEGLEHELSDSHVYTSFCCAAFSGNINMVRFLWKLVGTYGDLKYELLTFEDCWAFREAAKNGHIELARLLWDFVDDLKGCFLWNMGFWSCIRDSEQGYVEVVGLLWKLCGDDEDLRREILKYNGELFWSAIESGYIEAVRLLGELFGNYKDLKRKFFTNRRCYYAVTASAKNGNSEMLTLLWSFFDNCVDLQYDFFNEAFGFSFALTSAAVGGHVDVVKLLYRFFDKLECELEEQGCELPLYGSCSDRSYRISWAATSRLKKAVSDCDSLRISYIESLIKDGADVNKGNEDGRSILELAFENGHFTVAALLLDSGAKITEENVVPVLWSLRSEVKLYPLIDKVFKIVKEQGLEFDVNEAFKDAPLLKQRYKEVSNNDDTLTELHSQCYKKGMQK